MRLSDATVRADSRLPPDVPGGVLRGLASALAFTIIAAVSLAIAAAARRLDPGFALRTWLLATAFYWVTGAAGGALYGWLRPLRDRYVGKLLTAYLLLVLVYGGGTAAFWPILPHTPGDLTLAGMLVVWLVFAIPLAPMCVWIFSRR